MERGPLLSVRSESPRLLAETDRLSLARLEIVNPDELRAELCRLQSSDGVALLPLIRLFGLEAWVRNLDGWNVLSNPRNQEQGSQRPYFSGEKRANAQPW